MNGAINSPIKSLVDYDVDRLERELAAASHKPVHAARILRQFYQSGGRVEMDARVIGEALQRHLDDHLSARRSKVIRRVCAADGTVKLLVGFADGLAVESVLMPGFRADVAAGCVSSQVGCRWGAIFVRARGGDWNEIWRRGKLLSSFFI